MAVFERDALMRLGNINAERIANFSVVTVGENGELEWSVERPDEELIASLGRGVFVGMNSWSLPPEIYDACRSIEPSTRGELELPDAVIYARDEMGVPFRVLIFHDGVLDLSRRADIASVAERLSCVEPRL